LKKKKKKKKLDLKKKGDFYSKT